MVAKRRGENVSGIMAGWRMAESDENGYRNIMAKAISALCCMAKESLAKLQTPGLSPPFAALV